LDMRTTTEIARPKCNNFPNWCLIFAVDEAPAVNISAICFWVLQRTNRAGTLFWSLEGLLVGWLSLTCDGFRAEFGRNLGWLPRSIRHL
jgi:hypothetical protein